MFCNQNSLQRCSLIKYLFESPYISPTLSGLNSTQGINRKEIKLTKKDVRYIKDDWLMLFSL